MPRPEVVLVRDARHPHEVLVLLAVLLAGMAGVLNHRARSPIVSQLMPPGLAIAWYALSTLGAAVALVGVALTARTLVGLLVERVGLLLVGGLCLAYGLAALVFVGQTAWVGGGVTVAFGLASVIRARQVRRDLRALRRGLTGDDHV